MTLAQAAEIMRAALTHAEPVYCYAIQAGDGGPIKIGLAKNPAERLKTLQTANPTALCGLAAWRVLPLEEKQLHRGFAAAHIRGEWFHPTPELVDFVQRAGGEFEDWT